ncbi:MAG: RagB/SusD family nutrient uptake outer membrane protein [Bacteroidetes bacterium]|nr:RagB/SusD family nutrient uptake outer membrane protein [Bacteroidota bacterium]
MSKKIIITIVALAAIVLPSCKKFLDLSPKNDIGESEALNSKDRIERALTGAYSRLQDQSYYGFEWMNAVWLSDDNTTAVGAGTTDLQFDNHEVLASSNTMEIAWAAMYQAVNAANNVIDAVATVKDPGFTDAEKQDVSGQAYFIRALVYFDMARTWGGVPLVLKPTRGYDSTSNIAKSTTAEVYAQVLKDLNEAENRLPATLNRNIATKKAAQALKARLYLYLKDWSNAAQFAGTVIADAAEYSLVDPYDNLITVKNNTENIFELNFTPTDGNPLAGIFYPNALGGSYRIGPTQEIVTLLSDPTKAGGRSTLVGNSAGTAYANRYRRVSGDQQDDDVSILRLSEMYLIRAEAKAHQNDVTGGLQDLNMIRNRAHVLPAAAADSAALLLAIEDERRLEFAFEPFRWFDLVRTGRAAAVLGVTDARKYVFPIPTSEIVANRLLVQNEGY